MTESYMWVFRCPMCGQREPRWGDVRLSVRLGGCPPSHWFNEVGCGEIVLCSRGFYNVGLTSIVPSSIINYVKAYLSEHHQQEILNVQRSLGSTEVLTSAFDDSSNFVVFQDTETSEWHILSREQATIIHELKDQEKFSQMAQEKIGKIKDGIFSRKTPAVKYKNSWNRHYFARGVMELGGKTCLLDKADRVIAESIISSDLLRSQANRLRTTVYTRKSVFDNDAEKTSS